MTLTLVIGGTRSGKSAYAERLAQASGMPVRYVATADGSDPSMAERIGAHVARRPEDWTTCETGSRLADALVDADGKCVLLDGLGVWIAGAMHAGEDVPAQIEELLGVAAGATLIVVAEQAGEGVLPADRLSRDWLDTLGEATQRLAAGADHVELVVAGRALSIGGSPGRGDRERNGAGPTHDYQRPRSSSSHPADRRPGSSNADPLRQHGDSSVRPGDIDHAVNVIAGGPPQWLRDELREALERDADRYPDERAATAALAELHGRDPAEIVPTNGGAEALWLIPAALRPALAVCVHPGFTEAEAALRAHAIPVARVLRERARGFALDPDAVPAEADLVIVGNPASPSGTLDPAATLLALRRPGRVLVVDEAFMDLVPGEPATLVRERLDDVIVVRSLTKALSIPGLRVGYAVAAAALAQRLREVRPPWSSNALALAALAAAAQRPDALAAIAERSAAEREDLEHRLAGVAGVRLWRSAANFCLVQVADGPAVIAALRERRIAVRAAASFPGLGPGDLRLTARTPAENERLVTALAETTR
jgi:histidinol-phosphate/aromatic aminotransferase/cobyric acid decarboxylase-like protein/adenosyl cobinamide kinase/adenosyl cobinamide phosphate guanylyltransferase